jgi:hypothetical protein
MGRGGAGILACYIITHSKPLWSALPASRSKAKKALFVMSTGVNYLLIRFPFVQSSLNYDTLLTRLRGRADDSR